MAFGLNAQTLQHGQPHVAERCVFRQSKVLAQFQVGAAAGEYGWTVGEIMD